MEKISEETHARAPECMALKTDLIAKKRTFNEAEVNSFPIWGIKSDQSGINTVFY